MGPAVGLPVPAAPLVAHPNGAVTPDYTPAQKLAAADHLAAKAITYATRGPYLGLGHGLWKREAEAEPWLGYGLGAWGLGLKSAPCVNALNIPVPCAGKKKREAEAEAQVLLAGYPYAGIHAPNPVLGHALAYTGFGAVHSSLVGVCTNVSGEQVPC